MADKYPSPSGVKDKKPLSKSEQTKIDMEQDFGGTEPPYRVEMVGNRWVLTGKETAQKPGEVHLYINANGDYDIQGPEEIRTSYINDAKKTAGGVEGLRKKLYSAGFMNEVEYNSKDATAFAVAITEASRKITTEAVLNYVDNKILLTESFDKLLSKQVAAGAGTGGPKTGAGVNLSLKRDTDQAIDEYFFTMLGRRATPTEKQEYFDKVNKEEKAAVVKQTTAGGKTTTVGDYLKADDYDRIKANVLKPALKGTNLEDLTKGNGKVAQSVVTLKEYASSYGVRLDTKQALDRVMETFSPSGQADLDVAKNSIKSMSKGFYSNISNLIDEGVKPSDIANQYAYYKGQLLEIPDNSISIFDEDIQAALANKDASGAQKAGVMTLAEYEKLLRTNPKTKQLWLNSKKAKEEASSYASSILRMFGLMA